MYAQIAINAPVDSLYDYRVPPELEGRLQPGHLVQVPFGPGLQHGIVVELKTETSVPQTKLIQARLDPRPALTPAQISLGKWISATYLSPIGLCLWLLLPPGLTGERDVLITLIDPESNGIDELEGAVIALLKRRGPLRGQQMSVAFPGKPWKSAVEALVKVNVLERERILTPPKVKAQTFQTATLAITAQAIDGALRNLARPSRSADTLEMIAQFNGEFLATSKNRPTIDKLVELGLVAVADDGTVSLTIAPSSVGDRLLEFRKIAKPKRILALLAAADGPMDVSELYDQANVNSADLKRLDAEGLIVLGEQSAFRDSLADRGYVAATPPSLTPEQRGAWLALSITIDEQAKATSPFGSSTDPNRQISASGSLPTPPPDPLPASGEGETFASGNENDLVELGEEDERGIPEGQRWRTPRKVWEKIKPLAQQMRHEPTPAENELWEALRNASFRGYKFRRQHPIDRFIVDFYCAELKLIIEVDGEIHDYRREEDVVRQEFLESLGFRVIRFTNKEVINSLKKVLAQIKALSDSPSPLAERGVGGEVSSAERRSGAENPTNAKQQTSPKSPARNTTFLLHGVTGSGKTEIYLRAIERTLGHGRDAIFLVPEIALTAQTVRRVAARFGRRVAIVHSGLSIGERFDTWRRARDGQVQVIVGARSALFTPLPDVGLIVIDEEHDHSYKQSESGIGMPPPYYHTRQVAEEMMRRNHGVLIVGSATPDVEVMYRAKQGEIQLLEMPNRVQGHRSRAQEQAVRDSDDEAPMIELPPVQVVDMRRELKSGNTSIFSRKLQTAINETLDRREQAILFINRRGHATYVFCRDCGYVESCPRCESPLTYHRHGQALRCHRCGYEAPEPRVCPRCHSTRIKFFGAGTQQVEQALQIMYPKARIVRWDADTAATPDAHASIMQRFVDRRADILIGTQMVAKGLDLPMVTLVGVVSADMGVALPDFRAGERTFQLLTQVAGRAGRGVRGGQVVLQTYQPEHYAIDSASRHDYAAFYAKEIAYRREIGYPPFRRLVRVIFRSDSEPRARAEAERAAEFLRDRIDQLRLTGTELIGPAPCFFQKVNRFYRWHLLLRGPNPSAALTNVEIPKGWFVDVDPMDVL